MAVDAIDGWYRGQKGKISNEIIPIFSLGHYKRKDEGEDEHSKDINLFYKYGYKDLMDRFNSRFKQLYERRFKSDIDFDYVCVCPTSKKDQLINIWKIW
ncbi:MAG: hypothetical protein QXL47_00185 [Candidatus Anstonellales archaeon]